MRTWIMLGAFVLLAVALLQPGEAPADNGLASSWRSTYPDACATLVNATQSGSGCTVCHTGGFGFNAYGSDVQSMGIAGAEGEDSDGDGRTNLQEINDCTFPGDAGSVLPVEEDSWGAIKALFN